MPIAFPFEDSSETALQLYKHPRNKYTKEHFNSQCFVACPLEKNFIPLFPTKTKQSSRCGGPA